MEKKESPGYRLLLIRMKKRRSQIIFLLALIVLEIVFSVSNLGFIHAGRLSITILHIPVILAAVMLGLPEGLILACVFGLMSMYSACGRDPGSIDYLFRDPRIALIPRMLIPVTAWAGYKAACSIADDHTLSARLINACASAVCGSLANTVFVVLSLNLFYPSVFGMDETITARAVIASDLISINVLSEIFASAAAVTLAVLISHLTGIRRKPYPEASPAPIRKTFQKWLFLFMMVTFFFALGFMYHILTKQEELNAKGYLQEKLNDIVREIGVAENTIRASDLRFGNDGFMLLVEDGLIKKAGKDQYVGKTAEELGIFIDRIHRGELTTITIDGISEGCMIAKNRNTCILAFLPEAVIYAERNENSALLILELLVMFFAIYHVVTAIVRKNVVQKIVEVNESLAEIRCGNLEEEVNVKSNTEFAELSLGINTTVDALKRSMEEITLRNQKEMEFARMVQRSALPAYDEFVSLAMPFEICGDMRAAREVGGDFYDYFLIGEDKIGFVIADVSGKGVPAALLMMRAKTLVKNVVLGSQNPAEALDYANKQLHVNNEKLMFVTLWLGILDFREGILEFANAAHNPPLLRKAGEPLAYMDHKKYKRSLMLGAMEETIYRKNTIALGPDDMLFLYTDGVTEATNRNEQLYGEKRLKECIEKNKELSPEELIAAVHEDIDRFVDGAEQFDDITMVVLKMKPGGSLFKI